MMKPSLAALIMLALASCTFTKYAPIASCGGPSSSVRVLHEFPKEGTFTRCGSVMLEGGMAAPYASAVDAAKREAGRYGANAIVIIQKPVVGEYLYREGNAVAIRIH